VISHRNREQTILLLDTVHAYWTCSIEPRHRQTLAALAAGAGVTIPTEGGTVASHDRRVSCLLNEATRVAPVGRRAFRKACLWLYPDLRLETGLWA